MAGLTRGGGVTAALAALVLAVGCSLPGAGGGSSTSSAPPPGEPPASTPTGAPAGTTAASPSAGQPTPADPSASSGSEPLGEVFATRTSAMGGVKVTLQLYPLQRDGAVSHLNSH